MRANSSVAIVGGGPSGLVTAKFLQDQGFDPVIFERGTDVGGQWNAEGGYSGVWPEMRTNTSAPMTCFADLQHEQVSLFPHNRDIFAYLRRYASGFHLDRRLRLNCSVELIDREEDGRCSLRWREDSKVHSERFDRVVIASGRYQQPVIPPVLGLASFSGAGGFSHSFAYKRPELFRNKRVLVAGCAISALEIAADLATSCNAEVVSCNRRQRYIIPKMVAGVPTDHLLFTRFGALALDHFPVEVNKVNVQEFIERIAGKPQQYGARPAARDVFAAGITLCQSFLPLVAEGHITTRPWIKRVERTCVTFEDDSSQHFDAIIFGTGFQLALPFLSKRLAAAILVQGEALATSNLTFHPDVPNLAFVGMFGQAGPYFPVLELQARYVAGVWSGRLAAPTTSPTCTPGYLTPAEHTMHMSALTLSRAISAEPDIEDFPELSGALMFGPLSAMSFRLSGPDALPHAADSYAKLAAPFCSLRPTDEQRLNLAALERVRAATGAAAARR